MDKLKPMDRSTQIDRMTPKDRSTQIDRMTPKDRFIPNGQMYTDRIIDQLERLTNMDKLIQMDWVIPINKLSVEF